MAWLKLHACIYDDPGILAAGSDAADTFVAVLTMHKKCEWGASGVSSKLTPKSLSGHKNDTRRATMRRLRAGIEGLIREGLIVMSDDGKSYTIKGWDKWQGPSSSTERVRKHRAMKQLHPLQGNALEERRGEEKRGETPLTPRSGGQDFASLLDEYQRFVLIWASKNSRGTGPLVTQAREYQRWAKGGGSGPWDKAYAWIEANDPPGFVSASRFLARERRA